MVVCHYESSGECWPRTERMVRIAYLLVRELIGSIYTVMDNYWIKMYFVFRLQPTGHVHVRRTFVVPEFLVIPKISEYGKD